MPNPVETILTTVGLPAEDIAKISALTEEEQKTFDPAPFVDKVKNNYQTQLQNDPKFYSDLTLEKLPAEVKKKVESASFGRAANIVKDKLLKGLGMTEAEFEDLPTEQKEKIETFIPIIAERYTKTKAGDKQLQQDLIAARKELEKYGPDYEKGIETKYQTESEKKVTAAIFNAALIGELSAIQGLKIPASDIAATANQILQSKYGFAKVGDYTIELRQKEHPDLKVLKPNSSQELTLKEALIEIATERGWVEKEEDKKKGTGTFKVEPNGKGDLKMVVAPHIQDKISKKIASEQ